VITDDEIRANTARIVAKKREERKLFGFPVVEISTLDLVAEREDGDLRELIEEGARRYGRVVTRTDAASESDKTSCFVVSREMLEDAAFSLGEIILDALSSADLEHVAREWGLIDDEEARRLDALHNQAAIDASRAELKEILNGRR